MRMLKNIEEYHDRKIAKILAGVVVVGIILLVIVLFTM